MLVIAAGAVIGLVLTLFFSPEIVRLVRRRKRRLARRRARDEFH